MCLLEAAEEEEEAADDDDVDMPDSLEVSLCWWSWLCRCSRSHMYSASWRISEKD